MMVKPKKNIIALKIIVAFFVLATSLCHAETHPPAQGAVLPAFELAVPQDPEIRNYLGISGGGRFTISEIKAQVVIIEIFSMYCPFCQQEAPRVNDLYRVIQGRDDLKDKIKLLGIGVGNTDFEVDFFKEKYQVRFPLFSDKDLVIHKKLGEVRTPYFIGVRINDDGSNKVFYSKLGGFDQASQFLALILSLSGLE